MLINMGFWGGCCLIRGLMLDSTRSRPFEQSFLYILLEAKIVLGCGGKPLFGRFLCWLIWVSEGAVVWSEGWCWTWIIASPQKDDKDGLLKQKFNWVASRYKQEGYFILIRQPYSVLVWSCPVIGAFSVFTGAVYLLVFPSLSHRPPHPEIDCVDAAPLLYSILVQ
jgi:hypothetical protein